MELYAQEYGESGPPLVILHGLLGASGNWHTLSKNRFSERFHVYTVDQRNHGRSPHDAEHSYDAMAEDLRDFCDQHGLDRIHLLGHSMGGKTAMRFAQRFPERLEKLVVVDIGPKAYEPSHLPILEALDRIDPSRYDSRREVDRELAQDIAVPAIRQFLLKNLDYDREVGTYRWAMNLDALRSNYEEIIGALPAEPFDGPTLFVGGERSDYIQPADQDAIRSLFPKARFATVEGAGHWIHADRPDAFADNVVSFLTESTE